MTTTPTAAARASGTIKALEWRPDGVATTQVGNYTVWAALSGTGWRLAVPSNELNVRRFDSEAAAKAAAQADYEARILAQIQPDPEPQPVSEVERLSMFKIAMEGTDEDFRRYRYRIAKALRALSALAGDRP